MKYIHAARKLVLKACFASCAAALMLQGQAFAQSWYGSPAPIVVLTPQAILAAQMAQLQMMILLAPKPVTVDGVTIWIKCGYYEHILMHYTSGASVEGVTDGGKTPVDRAQLAKLVATGKATVVDEDALFGAPCP
jgi:hypothetical protein